MADSPPSAAHDGEPPKEASRVALLGGGGAFQRWARHPFDGRRDEHEVEYLGDELYA